RTRPPDLVGLRWTLRLRPAPRAARSGSRFLGDFGRRISSLVLCPLALNRRINPDNRVAKLIEKLVEPQHVLARSFCLPCAHCILALDELGQPVLALADNLI